MKKRKKQNNPPLFPSSGSRTALPDKNSEITEDYALRLAAMFRAELDGEHGQLDSGSDREPLPSELDSLRPAESGDRAAAPSAEDTVVPARQNRRTDAGKLALPDDFFAPEPSGTVPEPVDGKPAEQAARALSSERSEAALRASTRIALSDFDTTPFAPLPREPSLDELFPQREPETVPQTETPAASKAPVFDASPNNRTAAVHAPKQGWLHSLFHNGRRADFKNGSVGPSSGTASAAACVEPDLTETTGLSAQADSSMPDADFAAPTEENAALTADWSDDRLFAAVDALLADEAADRWLSESAPRTHAPEKGEQSASEAESNQAAAPQPETAPPAHNPAAAEPETEQQASVLWNPLALHRDTETDEPSQSAPPSRDTTGSLPTLEDLFGPTPEPASTQEEPVPSEVPREKKHGWLWDLFQVPKDEDWEAEEAADASAAEHETPSPAVPADSATPVLSDSQAEAAPTPPSGQAESHEAVRPNDSQTQGAPDSDADFPLLENLFGTEAELSQSTEPETIPMDLTEPAPVEAPAASMFRRRRSRRGGPETMTLEEFLSAAVLIEQKQTPEPDTRRRAEKRGVSGRHSRAETVSTAPENPDGLILTSAGLRRKAAEAAAAVHPPAPKRQTPAADTQKPAANERKAPLNPPAPPRGSNTVPSADVRPDKAPESTAGKTQINEHRHGQGYEQELLPQEEKSVLHPEEAYRIFARPLDDIGTSLILTGLFTILSLFFTLYLAQHWTFLPEIFSGGTTVYVLLVLLVLMILVNWKLYFRDWRDQKGLRPELLVGIATCFTALDCFAAASALRPPFTVVIGALLMIVLWGRYDRGLALITTVKVLRAEQLSAGVSEVPDITEGSRGLIRTEPDVERFMDKLETRDLTERLLRVYTPVAALGGIGLTVLISLWLKQDPLWTGSLIFLGSVPVTGLLAFPRLFYLLANRLSGAQAALCGYHGAEAFGGDHAILIGDDDIFPAGSLTLNGFKVYNGNPDRMIAYAAAACRSSGSALDPVFEDLLVTHNGRHFTVDNFRFYDSGGIGASIGQDVVLLGSLDFMRRMGVHMDKGTRVKQAVYMSLNGELAAVFAVRYNPPENLRRGLAAIAGNRHFKGILVTRTFLGTPGFLKAKFGIPTGAFHYPSTKERVRLSEAEMKRSGAQGAILAEDSFSGFAQAAAGGRMLRSATVGAAILTVLGGLIGMLLMGVLAALPAYETATAVNLLLYTAAWLAPTLLLTAWARHF